MKSFVGQENKGNYLFRLIETSKKAEKATK